MKKYSTLILSFIATLCFAQSVSRPQTPVAPFPYNIEAFQFENKQVGITLHGTLTLPEGEGPFPAAILISGSGPTDRDQTIYDHKTFSVIADYLTRQGIAVLRYDDRGVGESEGNHFAATSMDLADDTHAALISLARHGKIDAKHIGLIGHSEGGMIAPIVASKTEAINYIVMLAGPGVPIADLMSLQNRKVYESMGLPENELDRNETYNHQLYDILDTNEPISELYDTLLPLIHGYYESIPEEYQSLFGPSKEMYYISIMGAFSSPWFSYFIQFDPTPYLEQVTCPVFAVNGDKDIQVISSQNIEAIDSIFASTNHKDYTTRVYPNMNHLFQTCDKCDVAEYQSLEETFSFSVLADVSKWILERVN